jgi:hypothetical protein
MARHVCTANSDMRTLFDRDCIEVFEFRYVSWVVVLRTRRGNLYTCVYYADICVHKALDYFHFHHAFMFEGMFCVVTLCRWSNSL